MLIFFTKIFRFTPCEALHVFILWSTFLQTFFIGYPRIYHIIFSRKVLSKFNIVYFVKKKKKKKKKKKLFFLENPNFFFFFFFFFFFLCLRKMCSHSTAVMLNYYSHTSVALKRIILCFDLVLLNILWFYFC